MGDLSTQTLVEDINEIKTYLQNDDKLCLDTVKSFITRYDVNGKARLVRSSGSFVFGDVEFLDLLLDKWQTLLDARTFLMFVYCFCCFDDTASIYKLFIQSGGSTEILRAMDTDVKNRDLIYFGSRSLAILSGDQELRSSISDGDGIGLLVDSLHFHKKDPQTAPLLLLVLANLSYRMPSSKASFIEANGIQIVGSIILSNQSNAFILSTCFYLLRNVTFDDKVRQLEADNKVSIMKDVANILRENTQNEVLTAQGLWIILNLLMNNHANKKKFMSGEHGYDLLAKIAKVQSRNSHVMALVCTIIQQLCKLSTHRTELYFNGATALLGTAMRNFCTEATVLIPAIKACYFLALDADSRTSIGLELVTEILAPLKLQVHNQRLHSIIGKLILRLCKDEGTKQRLNEEHALEAVVASQKLFSDNPSVLKFMMASITFLTSPPGSSMPDRPDLTDLFFSEGFEDSIDNTNHSKKRRHASYESGSSSPRSDSSESSSCSQSSSDASSTASSNTNSDISLDENTTSGPKVDEAELVASNNTESSNIIDSKTPHVVDSTTEPSETTHENVEPTSDAIETQDNSDILNTSTGSNIRTEKAHDALNDSLCELDEELENLKNTDFSSELSDIIDDIQFDSRDSLSQPDPDMVLANIDLIEKMTAELENTAMMVSLNKPSTEVKQTEGSISNQDQPSSGNTPIETTQSELEAELNKVCMELEQDSPSVLPVETVVEPKEPESLQNKVEEERVDVQEQVEQISSSIDNIEKSPVLDDVQVDSNPDLPNEPEQSKDVDVDQKLIEESVLQPEVKQDQPEVKSDQSEELEVKLEEPEVQSEEPEVKLDQLEVKSEEPQVKSEVNLEEAEVKSEEPESNQEQPEVKSEQQEDLESESMIQEAELKRLEEEMEASRQAEAKVREARELEKAIVEEQKRLREAEALAERVAMERKKAEEHQIATAIAAAVAEEQEAKKETKVASDIATSDIATSSTSEETAPSKPEAAIEPIPSNKDSDSTTNTSMSSEVSTDDTHAKPNQHKSISKEEPTLKDQKQISRNQESGKMPSIAIAVVLLSIVLYFLYK